MEDQAFQAKRRKALRIYNAQASVYSPYFKDHVLFDSQGFEHLQYSRGQERTRDEQTLRFTLLPLAISIVKTATTAQEYRRRWAHSVGIRSSDGQRDAIEWWGFAAIYVKQDIGVRVVVERIGGGKLHFLSVMSKPIPEKARFNMWDDEDE